MILFSLLMFASDFARLHQARIMQSLGQLLEIEVFDKDEGNDDDKLGRWGSQHSTRFVVGEPASILTVTDLSN